MRQATSLAEKTDHMDAFSATLRDQRLERGPGAAAGTARPHPQPTAARNRRYHPTAPTPLPNKPRHRAKHLHRDREGRLLRSVIGDQALVM
jgi:hypothetical protein